MRDASSVLLRYQVRVVKFTLAVAIGIGTIAGISQAVGNAGHESELRVAEKRTHFWLVIDGQESGSIPTPDNRLARDLKSLIGPDDASATSLPEAVDKFRGNSNAYGGVTDAIGENPFDNAGLGCIECGPLTSEMKSKLLLVKQNRTGEVIASEQPPPPKGYTLTPFGWSFLKTAFVGWLFGGSLLLLVAFFLARLTSPVMRARKLSEIDWSLKTGDRAGKLGIAILAPLWFIGAKIWRSKYAKQVRVKYDYFYSEIAEIDKQLSDAKAVNPDSEEVKQLTAGRNELVSEFERVMGSGSRERVSLDGVRERLAYVRDTLDAYNERYEGGVPKS